jgi:Na+/H+-dicarboxylate symporter
MSEARAITNFIGNGVAAIVISKSENEFVKLDEPFNLESSDQSLDMLNPFIVESNNSNYSLK